MDKTMDPNPQDLLKASEDKLSAWPVTSLSHDEMVKWAAEYIPQRMIEILNGNDQPLQLVVHEKLFDAVTEALQNVEVPESATVPQGDTPEGFGDAFKQYCRTFPVRSATTKDLTSEVSLSVPVEDQFIIFLTLQGQQLQYLRVFDQKLGISQYINENRIPLALNQDDLLQMVKFFILLQCINRSAQNQVMPAKAQDLTNQIYRP